ncbi:MAG: alkaline phosphatase D family protein [Planctomycetota bacterium]
MFNRTALPAMPRWLNAVLTSIACLLLGTSTELIAQSRTTATVAAAEPTQRIAFGSCAKQDKPQPIWDAILAAQPQSFVFLGDNIYGDSEDVEVLKAKYRLLDEQPGFQRLRATIPVLGTWDDHDYGVNDGGVEYPSKRASQQAFLDFLRAPANDPRRQQEGVYWSQITGPPGKRVQLILLDTRYFRSPLLKGFQPGEPGEGVRGTYRPNPDPAATILGEAQWKWLAEQLQQPTEVRIIGSSIQLIADEHGSETWGNFPLQRRRMLQLIRDTKANGVIILSGDRHLAEIAKLDKHHADYVGYPLFDVTSSSLNVPSGNLTKSGVRFANQINSYRVGLTYFDTNFGIVDIDWEPSDPLIRLQVRDEVGDIVLQQRVRLSELRSH